MKCVSTFCCVAVMLLFSTTTVFGQLALEETFNTPTTNIATLPGWSDIPAGSSSIGSTQGPPNIVVNPNTALIYPGYIESGVGNAAYLSGGGQDAQVAVSTIASSGTVYLCFLIRVDSASTAGDYCWIVRNTSNHNRWRMWLKNSNGGANFEFGVGKGATLQQYTDKKYSFGTTYLVVAKYDFNTAATTDAKLSLWVNPASSSFGKLEDPSPAIKDYTEPGTSDFVTASPINRLALVQNGIGTAPTFYIGGIRMGLAWNVVLPPAPLYYSGTGPIDNPSNWGSNIDGSGTHPTDFASDGQVWLVRNTTAVNLTSTWVVSGAGSRVVVGPGVNFTIASSGILSGTIDVNSGGTLTLTRAYFWPTFGDVAGTVSLDNPAGISLDADYTFPAGPGYYDLKNGDLNLAGFTLTVKGRIRTNGNKVFGNGTFILDSLASIQVTSPNGITTSAAAGDIQTTTRRYSRYANYVYAGTRSQVTGDAIPDTVANLTIQMSHRDSTTTLSKPVATTGNLTLTRGKFKLGSYDLWFSNPSGQSDSGYVITNGTGALVRPVLNTGRKTMPVGSATEYRVALVTFDATPAATNMAFRYVSGDAGSVGLPDSVPRYYKGGYWVITSDGTPGGTFKLGLNEAGTGFDVTRSRILARANNTTAWTLAGTGASDSAGILIEQGVAKLGQFAIGERAGATGVEDRTGLPTEISLLNNYPNPFNPSTTISYELPAQMRVSLEVYNILGQQVATLVDELQPAGRYKATFDAAKVASGLYLYRLEAGAFVQTRKMLVLK